MAKVAKKAIKKKPAKATAKVKPKLQAKAVVAEVVEDEPREDEGVLVPVEDFPAVDVEFPPTEVAPPSNESKSLAVADPVTAYMAEIRKYPLLTPEQEKELAIRYRETGDAKAAEMLVTSNLRFVVKIAAEYSKFGARLIDLVQEGNIGLMQAVREYNPYKGARLITYAVWWIRGYIQDFLMRQYSLVRIGTTQNQRRLFYQLQKHKEELEAMGSHPDYKLLGTRLGVQPEEVESMQLRLQGRDVSLNQPLDDGSQSSLMDFQVSNQSESVDEQLEHYELIDLLKKNVDEIRPTLNEKEKIILDQRLLADEPLTLQEIGEKYSITREAIRQIEARLIQKIRKAITEQVEANNK